MNSEILLPISYNTRILPIISLFFEFIQLKIINPFSKFCPDKLADTPAPKEYQVLWEHAQNAVGVPNSRRLKLFNMAGSWAVDNPDALGVCHTDCAYINTSYFSKDAPPSEFQKHKLRFALFHEAVHAKYMDHTQIILVRAAKLFVIVIGGVMVLYLQHLVDSDPSSKFAVGYLKFLPLLLAVPLIMIHRWQQRLKTSQEHRADLEALNALRCHRCLSRLFNADRSKHSGVISTLKMLSKSGLKNSRAKFITVCPGEQGTQSLKIVDIDNVLENYKFNNILCPVCFEEKFGASAEDSIRITEQVIEKLNVRESEHSEFFGEANPPAQSIGFQT